VFVLLGLIAPPASACESPADVRYLTTMWPPDGAVDVPTDTILVAFGESILGEIYLDCEGNSVEVTHAGEPVAGFSYGHYRTLFWHPDEPLVAGETYTARFTLANEGSEAVSALLQTQLTSTFTVGQGTTPPPGRPEVIDAVFSFWTNEGSDWLTLSTTASVVLPPTDNHHGMRVSAFVGFDPEAVLLAAQTQDWRSYAWDMRVPGDVSPIRVELGEDHLRRPPVDPSWDLCCVVPVVMNLARATTVGAPYCEACPPVPDAPAPDAALPPPDAAPRPDVPVPDAQAPDAQAPDARMPDAAPRLSDAVVGDARGAESRADASAVDATYAASEGRGGSGCQAIPARPVGTGALALLLVAVGLAGARRGPRGSQGRR
jgi:hypothetical protein